MAGRKFIYLVNPISGTAKKEALLKALENISKEKNLQYEFVSTNAGGDYDFLNDKITKEKITDIILIGGDGTVNQATASLRNSKVRFAIVPLGSGNGLAFAAGIPKNPLKAFELALNGTAKFVDAFTINGNYSCMLSGVGFDAKVAHEFAAQSRRGLLAYTQQSLLHFFKAQPYQFEVILNNFSFFTDAFFISIANGNQFGNNVTIAPQANLNDGLLDVVIVQKMNKARLPFAVLKQIRGNNKLQQLVDDISKKTVLYFQVPSLVIKNLKYAPLHIDGEPRDTYAELKIEVIKDCFELVQP